MRKLHQKKISWCESSVKALFREGSDQIDPKRKQRFWIIIFTGIGTTENAEPYEIIEEFGKNLFSSAYSVVIKNLCESVYTLQTFGPNLQPLHFLPALVTVS